MGVEEGWAESVGPFDDLCSTDVPERDVQAASSTDARTMTVSVRRFAECIPIDGAETERRDHRTWRYRDGAALCRACVQGLKKNRVVTSSKSWTHEMKETQSSWSC